VITGTLDAKFTDLGRRLAGSLPKADHEQIVGVGHTCHLEAPDEFARLIASHH
jgi:pimeloyl-ACP methyl ester carboxylesterase